MKKKKKTKKRSTALSWVIQDPQLAVNYCRPRPTVRPWVTEDPNLGCGSVTTPMACLWVNVDP